MKNKILFIVLFSLFVAGFAKDRVLFSSQNEDGIIVVYNGNGYVEDKLHFDNHTNSNLEIIVNGVFKKNGTSCQIAKETLVKNDRAYFSTNFEDKLDKFREFYISLSNGKILSFKVVEAHSDLYFDIFETDVIEDEKKDSSISSADELLKWKKLLDMGVITQEEFDAKKKSLINN